MKTADLREKESVPNGFFVGQGLGHSNSLQPEDVLTLAELAQRLKVPKSWVYKQAEKHGPNCIPVLRCGRYLRFCWPDVCAWLRSSSL